VCYFRPANGIDRSASWCRFPRRGARSSRSILTGEALTGRRVPERPARPCGLEPADAGGPGVWSGSDQCPTGRHYPPQGGRYSRGASLTVIGRVTADERIAELVAKALMLTPGQIARLQVLLALGQRQRMSIRDGSKPRPRRLVGSTITDSASTLMMARRRERDNEAQLAATSPPIPATTLGRINSA
jgi:hypothetical protein